jgi:hypothetical protein
MKYKPLKPNCVPLAGKQAIPTERAPIVGEVNAYRGCRLVSAKDSQGRLSRLSRPHTLLSIQVVPQLSSRGWVDPVPDSLLLKKLGSAGNRTRDLWYCSQEL